jgi:hypothetical protein
MKLSLVASPLILKSYEDFFPLFGEEKQSAQFFRDAVRGNNSTRILYAEDGREILLYSFINQRTVVITTSSEALSRIITEL